MRRARLTGQSAVFDQVDRLINKFEYPDIDTLAPASVLGGGGGAPTVVVAASDATDLSKSKADFVCPGVNDETVIQAACDLLGTVGGRVLLTEGTFSLSDVVAMGPLTTLQGMGSGATILTYGSTTGPVITVSHDSTISDLFLLGFSPTDVGIDANDEDRVTISGVWFSEITMCISLGGDYWTITNCGDGTVGGAPTYFVRDVDTFTRCRVVNNNVRGDVDMGDGEDWIVVANNMEGAVSADGGSGGAIVGNVWLEGASPAAAGALIDVANLYGLAVSGNAVLAAGDNGIELDTVTNGVVTGNQVRDGDVNVYLTGCTEVAVSGNQIQWSGSHNVHLDGSNQCDVVGNSIVAATSADNIRIEGDDNLITANHMQATVGFSTADIGINVVSGSNNAVYANYLGDSSDYGTADSADTGTATQTDPTAGAIGGQFAY